MINMRKIRILLFAMLFPILAMSQVEIVPSVGYMLGGGIKFYEGKLKIQDGMSYGASLIIPEVKFATDVEINYTRMDSRATFTAYPGYPLYSDEAVDISTNYIQVGVLKDLGGNDRVMPFGSFSMGATIFSPKAAGYSDTWRFSITLGLGAKLMFTDRVGVMLRARMLLPMNFGGVGGYYGFGSGGSGGGLYVDSYATIVQGDFSGGLILKLGR